MHFMKNGCIFKKRVRRDQTFCVAKIKSAMLLRLIVGDIGTWYKSSSGQLEDMALKNCGFIKRVHVKHPRNNTSLQKSHKLLISTRSENNCPVSPCDLTPSSLWDSRLKCNNSGNSHCKFRRAVHRHKDYFVRNVSILLVLHLLVLCRTNENASMTKITGKTSISK